ncbi:Na+/H+ antiporter subunit E [Methylobrevis albus]|uniref:Na+/H+ antiporter subunit E n=1 Tax=Methylobrevis albus TaxID=2793297 RepID=A0A931HZ40_9HYPH|nr:Na+/H+ antiporter subunit E [Methylobrevis albus]MBH0237105.1 Na+/H+ antiporter subunit E [Methylobrevis albus]
MNGLRLANLVFMLLWATITESFSPANLVLGFLLSVLVLYVVREPVGQIGYLRRTRLIFGLIGMFLRELMLSAIKVAKVLMRRDMRLNPGFFAYPLTVDRDFEITLLANLITLTPGTMSVDVSDDRKTIFIHAIDVPDVDAAIADIRNSFEAKILETFR